MAMVASAGPVERVRIGRSHDGDTIVVFARVMLFQAIAGARKGDVDERAWLLDSGMAELCFEICSVNPMIARLALTEQWRRANGNGGAAVAGDSVTLHDAT